MHAVKFGGVWHHPNCPKLPHTRGRHAPASFVGVRPEASSNAVDRMLILFRPLAIVFFYTLGASTIALATVAACAWLSG